MTSLLLRCFNSNMVRLKGRQLPQDLLPLTKFQFQYGSIKRRDAIDNQQGESKFQFQYGSIKSLPEYYDV